MRKTADTLIAESGGKSLSKALSFHAEEISVRLAGGEGRALLAKFAGMLNSVHSYSFQNMCLQWLQAPDSRLVASMAAFDKIARQQGHEAVQFGSRKPGGKKWEQYTMKKKGAKAVYILMPCIKKVDVQDPETGEERKESQMMGFKAVTTWAAEEIVYADTKEPFQVPDLRCPVQDRSLYDKLLDFCREKGITVKQEALGGTNGISRKGEIGLNSADSWQMQVKTLVHEIVHEILHPTHKTDDSQTSGRELEAELGAAIVSLYFGYDVDFSLAYLESYKASPREILKVTGRVVKAAADIVSFIGQADAGPSEAAEAAADEGEASATEVESKTAVAA